MADSGADSNTGKVSMGSEGIQPTETECHLSSEKRVDGSLRESSTRDKENENIYNSPTIEGLKHQRNGVSLVKIGGGKIYALPFSFATKPQIIYSEGFYCIMHDNVWYQFQQYSLDSLHLQNMQTKNCIKLIEYSKSMHGTGARNKKHTNSSHNECQESLDSQTIVQSSSMAMEAITNTSVETAESAEGRIVTETDKLAAKRTEINKGETCETHNEEKPIDESEDKSRTGATMSSGGNAVKGFEAEIDTNIDQTHTGDPVQRFKGEFSRGETNNISGDTDNTKEDESQASKEEVIQSKRRSARCRLLRKTGKKPKKEILIENVCEIEGIDRVENFGYAGSTSEGNVSNISSSPGAATETISGNTQILKLLIKYLKKQGKKTEAYHSKHMVPCSMNLQLMWNFFMLTDCGKKMLDMVAANHHCKLSLSADDNFKEFFILQVLNTQFLEESDVKHFVDEVLHNIEICAKESLCIDTFGIDPKIQDEVRERIKDGQELANVWVEFVGEDNPVTVYTVCPKDHQQLVMQIITEVITDATKSFNSHKEMVMADFMWQIVMTRFEYLKEIGLKFPRTEIIQDKSQNAFLLKGPHDEVKAVAGHLEELLKMAHKEVHEKVFSPGYQFEIFTSSEMCDYIDKSLPKLPVIWIPNHLTKEIHLFSRDPELLKVMDKSIRGCIEERLYPLSKQHSELSSEQMKLLKELMKKHGGKIVISLSQSPTGLLLTTADDIFKDVDAAVQTIISSEIDEVHLETLVPEKHDGKDEQPGCKSHISNPGKEMKDLSSEKVSDVVQKITRSLEVKDENIFRKLIIMEHMEKINQIAKEHCVSVKVCETQSRVGFVLNGLEKEVQFIYDAIRLQEQQFQQDISVIAGATGKVHKQMLPNSDAAGKSGGNEMSGQLLTDPGSASEDGATAMVSEVACEKIVLVEDRSVYECMIKVVRWIKKTGLEHTVEVRELNEPPKVGFVLQGPSDRVHQMTDYMKKVQESIITQNYSAFSASDVSYLSSTEGRQILAKLEKENNCTIEITYPGKVTLVEDLYSAKPEDPGLEQRVWSYPNGKKIMLVKATSCDADVIIIPGNSDKDSLSDSEDKNVMRFKVPDGTEMKEVTVLQQKIKEILDRILEKTVGICIQPMEGWNFLLYLKCFLYGIYKCFMRNEGKPCPIECVILLVDDTPDYNKAVKIIQKSFRLEQDKSEVFAAQRLLLQEQGSIFKRIHVKVQKGQLHEAQAEVLVNTVDRSLDLTKGVISSSLLDKAGKGIQMELQQYQGNVGFGEILKTGVGTLPKPCMVIFHGVLFVYEEHSDCVKVFQDFLAGCLEDADKKYRSIAFPPIGTGKLRYPKDLVASIMFQSVANFENAHPKSNLEEVIFVIYEKDQETLKVFEDLYRRCVETPVAYQKTVPAVSGVSKMLKYGQVQVQAKLGTFENESHNCLLVFWEKQCLFNISDKNHILHSAGSTVTQRWRDHRNSRQFHQDVVLVTPGGNLRYTEIIHVACDINNINNAAKAGLMKADSEKMKTVVVPVTHNDSFQRDANKFCIEILKAVKELGTKLKFVQSVSLVIQGQHNFPFFNDIFEKQSRMSRSEKKTDDAFEQVKEMHVTEAQGASPSSSKNVLPKATIEMIKDPSSSVDRSVPSSQKKTDVKEPISPDITEVDRSGGDTGPLKAILPGKEQHKSTELQYSSEKQYCILVCDVKQDDANSLEDHIKSFGLTVKFVYPCKVGEALIICTNSKDKNTLLKKLKQYKVQSVSPQEIQGLTAAVDPLIGTKARKVKKKQDTAERKSEINISHTESSNQFEVVTSQQLEMFVKETPEINVQKRSSENSISEDIENNKQIENVSQTDFLAIQSLEVYSEWTQKFSIRFTYEKDTLHIHGAHSDLSEEKKKEIEKEIATLRGKQKIELLYDPQEKMQFKSAVDEEKSDELLLVWDDDNKQVLVYSDSYDVMQKFKHRVEFKMGKRKLTGRSGRRFVKQEDTMPSLSEEESPTKKKIARSFSWSQDATNVEVFKTLEGIMVKVYKANILRLDVDCIVNAANDNLQHGGGVALVIAKGAGPKIDREGSEILKIRGRINVGEQCVTTAGNLPYDCVIHTVGPRWSDYYPHDARNIARCETDLFNSIIGCFIEAENRHLKSIALPAISSGIFAVPRDVCTEQYAKAVIHYSKRRTSLVLQEIHFIDMVPGIVNDMQLAFKRHLSCEGNAKHIVNDGDQTTAIDDLAERDSGNKHGKIPEKDVCETLPKDDRQTEEKKKPAAPLWPVIEQKYFKKEKFLIYKPNNKIEVNVYMADITKLTGMQVITCSDDRSGNGHGAIASTLLKTGKSKYESIKKKAFQKDVIHFGDVIITEGGDSNFQLVVHAVLPSFKDTISSQKHKEMVHKCYDRILNDINKLQKTSLTLPLLGAVCAELGYEGSAKLFLDSLEVFCNRTTTFNLKIIHIVDKDEHITQKISNEFIKHTERVRNHVLATHGKELKPTMDPSSHTSSVRPQEEISQLRPKNPMPGEQSKEDCSICLAEVKSAKTLSCGHTFCIKCVEKQFRTKQVCPKCGTFHGTIYGDQPEGGKMNISFHKQSLAGFDKTDTLIKIEYQIPSGTQGPNHPKPGKRYSGIIKTAYLPDTTEGRKVCDLLKVAFGRRLIFTFGRSSQGEDTLIWNDIYHKTKFSGKYGYPDPGYLKRVQEQLAAKGVTVTDLVQETPV